MSPYRVNPLCFQILIAQILSILPPQVLYPVRKAVTVVSLRELQFHFPRNPTTSMGLLRTAPDRLLVQVQGEEEIEKGTWNGVKISICL